MGASAEEIKKYLEKRGYKTEVEEVARGNFKVSLYSSSVDAVVGLLAQISEGSRFVVAVHHPDFFELVEQGLQLDKFRNSIHEEMESQRNEFISITDGINKRIDEVTGPIDDRLKKIEKRPWWKFWSK